MRSVNNSLETVNAAATAIVNAEGRVQQSTVQKRRWGSCWGVYWCFGSHRHAKRIGHAILGTEPLVPGTAAPANENSTHPPTIILPFVAPPPSPASFLQSEPPSATQSPNGLLSLSPSVYSPVGTHSIFAIGPYAHETQLVSPPVFSTFTTEPSTAPFTPPPEPMHLTTPSSPEVPFAQLLTSLDPNHRTSEVCQNFPLSHYEFQSYQLYPGSPVGQLISPRSVISGSGTSSPFPDHEVTSGGHPFLEFHLGDPPRLWSIDGLSTHKWGPRQGSGSLTPDAVRPTYTDSFHIVNQISKVVSLANSDHNDDILIGHRVSFELTAEKAPSSAGASVEVVSESLLGTAAMTATTESDGLSSEAANACECHVGETSSDPPEDASGDGEEKQEEEQPHRQQSSLATIGPVKEFIFENADGEVSSKPTVGSGWWANEKVVGKEAGPHNNWAFFPVMQPSVS